MTEKLDGLGWYAEQLKIYLVLCVVGWVVLVAPGAVSLVSFFDDPAPALSPFAGYALLAEYLTFFAYMLFMLAIPYGLLFGVLTALLLAILVPLRHRPTGLKLAALAVLPLPVVYYPIGLLPNGEYGSQLLIQGPIQVALAMLLRPAPPPGAPPGQLARSRPWTFATWRPPAWWYPLPVMVAAWLGLLITAGAPVLGDWLPLGPSRTARPVTAGDIVVIQAEPGERYNLYERVDPTKPDEGCYERSMDSRSSRPIRLWTRPAGQVTYQGDHYTYRTTVRRDSPGPIEMSCSRGPLLAEDSRHDTSSPVGPSVLGAIGASLSSLVLIAWRRRQVAGRPPDGFEPASPGGATWSRCRRIVCRFVVHAFQ